jgi:hypothetical protein
MFRWKLACAVLTVLLVTVCFVGLYQFEITPVNAEPSFIDVVIEGSRKLGVNETGVYSVVVKSETLGNLDFTWSLSPQDNKTVLIVDTAVFTGSVNFGNIYSSGHPFYIGARDNGPDKYFDGTIYGLKIFALS